MNLGQDEHETDAKNRSLTNSASELTNLLQMVIKHFMLLNRSVLMSELEFRPKLRVWAKMRTKHTQKFNEFSFRAHETLRNGKKNVLGF